MFDLIIENGQVVDGTGAPIFRADVGIAAGKVAALGNLSHAGAARRIDAAGLVVAPGFIDMHNHSDTALLANPLAESYSRQGCTTLVIGHCGHTTAPISPDKRTRLQETLAVIDFVDEWKWPTFGAYLDSLAERRTAVNVVPLVGHCAIRAEVVGFDNRPATEDELRRMRQLIAQSMDEGAWGFSVGLMYPPSLYARTDELVELCRTVAERDGLFAMHMRSYSSTVVESVAEACEIARISGVRTQIAHLGAAGRPNWGKIAHCLELIDDANRTAQIRADKYPYTAVCANLNQRLPGWTHAGGADAMLARLADPAARARIRAEMDNPPPEWTDHIPVDPDCIVIALVASERNKWVMGKSIAEVAAQRGCDPTDAILDLILEERNRVTMIAHAQLEEETSAVIAHRYGMVASDGWAVAPYGPLGTGKPHPRCYGTFPRVLSRYVREQGMIPLEEAVHKMTGAPAAMLKLEDRGTLAVGKAADICIFDPGTVRDRADYADPHQYPDGIPYVIVNGSVEIENGKHNGTLKGVVLRG